MLKTMVSSLLAGKLMSIRESSTIKDVDSSGNNEVSVIN